MPDRAGIHEDDDITIGGLGQLDDLVTDKVLGLNVVLWWLEVKRSQETFAGDPFVDDIGGEHEVRGAAVHDTVGQDSVDLRGGGVLVGEIRVGLDELLRRDMVRVVAAITEGVVEHGLAPLLGSAGYTDNVEDGDVLGESTSNTVGSAELSDTECGDENTKASLLDSTVAIGGIGGVEFVTASVW